ncbi:hypothetical protein [Belnapia rosea]|uniref:Uncharacterized protein n=1 Tax=Belnapia rosea TaxID=938405 RepID=A0A1G6W7I6_9PROT|nr:hypothetical protein [Belnapia rosea]SDB30954.1 hypothetical protein SAMN02927895_01061 [Belnapia rosea]SDD61187.1 hypothetical protein SAMN04487779_101081 [Belnapia rosea]
MPDSESGPAGFESHWDADWFKNKSEECRRLAGLLDAHPQQAALLALADDFRHQSEHARQLAAMAVANRR